MRVESCIAKEKIIIKSASNNGLTILRATDKESAHEFVQETLQEARETADDWFIH
ncbi:DinI-like family protein [Escherichia coli]|uniref:DinI-like family protein n=1 Tax=Escherichia coli TaxID=562 RepID=UPI001A35E546|nr:DinI-like family protein [Escherichia coli]MBI9829794.1 DinI-like family protein [Escherichia coli]HAX8325517.1 DinI family protein [Escherichia coli]